MQVRILRTRDLDLTLDSGSEICTPVQANARRVYSDFKVWEFDVLNFEAGVLGHYSTHN